MAQIYQKLVQKSTNIQNTLRGTKPYKNGTTVLIKTYQDKKSKQNRSHNPNYVQNHLRKKLMFKIINEILTKYKLN